MDRRSEQQVPGHVWLQQQCQNFANEVGRRFSDFSSTLRLPLPQQQQHFQHLQHNRPRVLHLASVSAPAPPSPVHALQPSSQLEAAASVSIPPSYQGTNSKAELGRATWTLLHTLAAQFPEKPTKQQEKDARQLIECLTRIYPCAECAGHFREIVKNDPPVVTSGRELQRWTCRVHNVVNRSIGKPSFNCDLVASRWAPLECGEGAAEGTLAASACDMTLGQTRAGGGSGRGASRR